MDASKDYYAILGVLPSAEEIVIRAAYKALAQRYHPHRLAGLADEANRRMAQINDAYSVLSDIDRRREYDKLRGSRTQSGDSYFNENETDEPSVDDPLQKDWQLAVSYYPDLLQVEAGIAKISWRLAYSFRAYLLEAKAFESRAQVAATMEQQFLRVYFGANPAIVNFARKLISAGHKRAARALNEAVRVLGSNVEAGRVIDRITVEFDVDSERARELQIAAYQAILSRLGYHLTQRSEGWEVREPLGGRAPLHSLEQLAECVKARELQGKMK